MGLVDWRILAVIAALGVVALAIGLRGRRVDGLPRCGRRRCRYELTSLLGESRPGAGYPAVCPECGRVARSERDVKRGRRRVRRWSLGAGALLVALATTPLCVEAYARATSANPYAWAPTWLLVQGVERDTVANGFNHQRELLRRADADEISGEAAKRLTAKILEWQRDERVYWGTLGDVFASLTLNGKTTPDDVREFWDRLWLRFEVVGRPKVAFGDAPLVEVHGVYRGHGSRTLVLRVKDGDDVWLPSHFGGAFSVDAEVSLRDGGGVFPVSLARAEWVNAAQGFVDAAGMRSVWHPIVASDSWERAKSLRTAYSLDVRGRAVVGDRPGGANAAPRAELESLGLRTSWPFSGTINVEPTEPEGAAIELVKDEAMRAGLARNATAILRVQYGRPVALHVTLGTGTVGPGWIAARSAIDPALSYELFVRAPDGVTLGPRGGVLARTLPTGVSVHDPEWLFRQTPTALSAPGVVILRPSAARARGTSDITRILAGEIEIPIVVDYLAPGAAMPRPGEMSRPPPTPATGGPASRPAP